MPFASGNMFLLTSSALQFTGHFCFAQIKCCYNNHVTGNSDLMVMISHGHCVSTGVSRKRFTSIVDELPLQRLGGECVDGVDLQLVIILAGSPRGLCGLPLLALLVEALDLALVASCDPPDIPSRTKERNSTLNQSRAMRRRWEGSEELERHSAAPRSPATPTCRWTSCRSGGSELRCCCRYHRTRCPRR